MISAALGIGAPAAVLAAAFVPVAAQEARLRFQQAGEEFAFDTGVLRGKLRAGGRSLGLSSVVHVPTGAALSRSMGLLSHYRVFSANRRYGDGAWDWPSTAQLREDGSVEVHWPPAPTRPFQIRALYRWSAPGWLDLETTIQADEELPDFEAFIASYFTQNFNVSRLYAGSPPSWLPAAASEGVWQMFPRDPQAVAIIQDGRWSFPPSPVQWAIRPAFAQPLAVRRAESLNLTAVVMAPRQDCFAVATPHQTESHYSLYLSLFGRTIHPGERARARARLVIASALEQDGIPALYRAYLKQIERR